MDGWMKFDGVDLAIPCLPVTCQQLLTVNSCCTLLVLNVDRLVCFVGWVATKKDANSMIYVFFRLLLSH